MNNLDENTIGLGAELTECLKCSERINNTDFYSKYGICPFCNYHYSIDFSKRLEILSDKGTFVEFNKSISVRRPKKLNINDSYKRNVKITRERTGLEEAAITGTCNIGGIKVVVILLDFGFLGGSMGLIVGEKISKAFKYAAKNNLPIISIISSGGRRMQEGVFSLLQMIKTVTSTKELEKKNLPHIALFTNPSGGQVYGSFSSRADVKFAEPGTLMGMFSLNELNDSSKNKEKIDISSENFYAKGLLDKIISRNNLKKEFSNIIELLTNKDAIPKKIDLELPNLNFSKSNHQKHLIDKGRPSSKEYIKNVFDDFYPIGKNEDKDLSTIGIGKIASQSSIVIAQNYDRRNSSKIAKLNNSDFLKIFHGIELSKKFKLPIIFFVDNKGINNTFENEIDGIANNLSKAILTLSNHEQILLSMILGETSAEASLPYFISDKVMMLENSIFYTNSNIRKNAKEGVLSSIECLDSSLIDSIIPEPPLGASKGPEDMARIIKINLIKELSFLNYVSQRKLINKRFKKFQEIDIGNRRFLETVSSEMQIWKNVLEAGYKALKN